MQGCLTTVTCPSYLIGSSVKLYGVRSPVTTDRCVLKVRERRLANLRSSQLRKTYKPALLHGLRNYFKLQGFHKSNSNPIHPHVLSAEEEYISNSQYSTTPATNPYFHRSNLFFTMSSPTGAGFIDPNFSNPHGPHDARIVIYGYVLQ